MKDSNLLLEALELIDSKMQNIAYEKNVVNEISDTFTDKASIIQNNTYKDGRKKKGIHIYTSINCYSS